MSSKLTIFHNQYGIHKFNNFYNNEKKNVINVKYYKLVKGNTFKRVLNARLVESECTCACCKENFTMQVNKVIFEGFFGKFTKNEKKLTDGIGFFGLKDVEVTYDKKSKIFTKVTTKYFPKNKKQKMVLIHKNCLDDLNQVVEKKEEEIQEIKRDLVKEKDIKIEYIKIMLKENPEEILTFLANKIITKSSVEDSWYRDILKNPTDLIKILEKNYKLEPFLKKVQEKTQSCKYKGISFLKKVLNNENISIERAKKLLENGIIKGFQNDCNKILEKRQSKEDFLERIEEKLIKIEKKIKVFKNKLIVWLNLVLSKLSKIFLFKKEKKIDKEVKI